MAIKPGGEAHTQRAKKGPAGFNFTLSAKEITSAENDKLKFAGQVV